MVAATASLSAIVTPSSSSSIPLIPPPTHHSHYFTHFSPKPTKPLIKTLSLKPYNFTLPPLTLLFPLHFCQCTSSAFVDVDIEVSDELEENPDDVQGEEVQEELGESEIDENDEFEGGENDDKASDSSDDGRLYVGNLPYSMISSQLSDIFSQAGHIKSVEITYDKMTDRSRGFGFVTMESIDEAREAIRMFDGSQVGGRTIKVNFPEVPKGGERKMMGAKARISNQSFVDTPHKIYAGNLGWGVTTQGLRDAFADQAGFLSAKVVYERESGRSRGFGFISFSSAEAAQSAISVMNGSELEGRPLRLNIAADRSRPNSEADGEQSQVHSAINS